MTRSTVGLLSVLLACGCSGCRGNRGRIDTEPTGEPRRTATAVELPLPSAAQFAGNGDKRPELKWYGWFEDSLYPVVETTDTLWDRFAHAPPTGYSGSGGEPESWNEWLRLLPLAAPGTPVRNYRGEVVVPGDDEHLAAVVAIDVGTRDLQRSADVILRLYAEWRWFREDFRMLYLSDTSLELPLERWKAGERLVPAGTRPRWVTEQPPRPKLDHAAFREYLDSVFSWSDGRALLAESLKLSPENLEPGAFFVHAGHSAEVLVVLEVATSRSGERAMLLAHAASPAENIHVLRPNRDGAWFPVRTDQPVRIPRAQPFDWKELRRMKPLRTPPEFACIGSLCPNVPSLVPKHVR
jgi:hypothetical protein